MKLFMCVNYPIYNPAIGISKKINSQIENFEKLGFEVTYTAYTQNGIGIYCGNELLEEIEYPKYLSKKARVWLRKFYWLKEAKRFLEHRQEYYDVGFVRWGAVDRSFLNMLNAMKLNCGKIIMDCHGYHKNYHGHSLKGLYIEKTTKRNGNKLSQYIDVCLTETKNTELFGINAIPMDTGIDVEKYQPHHYEGSKDEIHMISVTNELSYHGYDRIIRGIAEYNSSNVYLHLVGKIQKTTKRMISEFGLEKQIILYGYQMGENLTQIYNKCNIGVGPLAPHRIGGKEGTGIKTKEYFAIGLPYFYAGQELLVPDDYPYVLKLAADESPIDIESVITFFNNIRNESDMQEQMRDFAKENFSWEKIFLKALEM